MTWRIFLFEKFSELESNRENVLKLQVLYVSKFRQKNKDSKIKEFGNLFTKKLQGVLIRKKILNK